MGVIEVVIHADSASLRDCLEVIAHPFLPLYRVLGEAQYDASKRFTSSVSQNRGLITGGIGTNGPTLQFSPGIGDLTVELTYQSMIAQDRASR
jgi:hypothetical protein